MVLTITDNNKFLVIDSCTQNEYDQLKISLTKKINGWKFHPLVKKGLWDGQVSFIKGNKIPSGLWYEVMEICTDFNFECRITNLKKLFDLKISKDKFIEWANSFFKTHKLTPRDYQIETAYKILRYNRCLAELATSAGKSLILFMVITYLLEVEKKKKILLIVPNISLVVQASEDFEEYNNGSYSLKIQQIYSGKKLRPSSNLVIGTYQSLVKFDQEYFNQFDVVSIDECLHPDTRILMYDNSYKKISEVKKGDFVKTTNDITNKIEIKEVEYVYTNLSQRQQMYEIEMENGETVKITGNHKVKLKNKIYVRVDELTTEENIIDFHVHDNKIKQIKKIDYTGNVYNLRIKSEDGNNHNYFANNINVSNCHKTKSASIRKILDMCWHCDYRFGVSGTISKRGNIDYLTLMSNTGPVITNISANYLQNKGHISQCKVYIIYMDYATSEEKQAFSELYKSAEGRKKLFQLEQNFIINSEKRVNFVTTAIKKFKSNSLILFYRIEHGTVLYNKLRNEHSGEVLYVDGNTDDDTRELYKRKMEEGVDKILVASFGTFSTGINIKNIHNIALTESFKSEIIIRQSIGRGLRKHNKKALLKVYDFVDDLRFYSDNKTWKNYLYKHSEARIEIYKEQKFEYIKKNIKF